MMKNIIQIFISTFISLTMLTACGGKSSAEGEQGSPTNDTNAPSITKEYLVGKWCYDYMEAGYEGEKQRDESNINYWFKEDGNLLYQNNPNTPVEKEGSYIIGEGTLKIKPALQFMPEEIKSVEENSFTLGNSVTELGFSRGACDE